MSTEDAGHHHSPNHNHDPQHYHHQPQQHNNNKSASHPSQQQLQRPGRQPQYNSIDAAAETHFVKPSDLLRPQPTPRLQRSDTAEDRDERAGLKAIRDFLRVRSCYEVLPLSFRLIELDVGLTVKESLNILVQCGIVSAPLWDSNTSTYAGLLTVNDYLNVVRYYNLHTDKLKDVDNLLLSDLKEVEQVLQVRSPETISTSPEAILYDALKKQLLSRARRIPLVSYDSESQRTMVVSVITQYRILKFIAINVSETDKLRKPLKAIRLGTYENVFRCSMEATVLDVIDEMVTRNISSVPVCTTDGKPGAKNKPRTCTDSN